MPKMPQKYKEILKKLGFVHNQNKEIGGYDLNINIHITETMIMSSRDEDNLIKNIQLSTYLKICKEFNKYNQKFN